MTTCKKAIICSQAFKVASYELHRCTLKCLFSFKWKPNLMCCGTCRFRHWACGNLCVGMILRMAWCGWPWVFMTKQKLLGANIHQLRKPHCPSGCIIGCLAQMSNMVRSKCSSWTRWALRSFMYPMFIFIIVIAITWWHNNTKITKLEHPELLHMYSKSRIVLTLPSHIDAPKVDSVDCWHFGSLNQMSCVFGS